MTAAQIIKFSRAAFRDNPDRISIPLNDRTVEELMKLRTVMSPAELKQLNSKLEFKT